MPYLQADGHVDPAAEGGAHSACGQAQVFEELAEGLCQGDPRPLLCNHHACTHTGQAHPLCLGKEMLPQWGSGAQVVWPEV